MIPPVLDKGLARGRSVLDEGISLRYPERRISHFRRACRPGVLRSGKGTVFTISVSLRETTYMVSASN